MSKWIKVRHDRNFRLQHQDDNSLFWQCDIAEWYNIEIDKFELRVYRFEGDATQIKELQEALEAEAENRALVRALHTTYPLVLVKSKVVS